MVTREHIWRPYDIPAGCTPLDIARRFQYADVIALLMAATAGQ